MPAVLVPRTRQPQGVVPVIDGGFAWVGPQARLSPTPGQGGLFVSPSTATTIGTFNRCISKTFTVITVYANKDASQAQKEVLRIGAGSTGVRWDFATTAGGANPDQWTLNGVANGTNQIRNINPFDTKPRVNVASFDPVSFEVTSGELGGKALLTYIQTASMIAPSNGSVIVTGGPIQFYAVIILPYRVSQARARQLIQNPWQLFQPEQRLLWQVVAGGDVSVALSGVLGTMSLGSLLASNAVPLSGLAGTLSVGTMLPDVAAPLSGLAGTLGVGSVLPETAAPVTGVEGTLAVGTVGPSNLVPLSGVLGTLSLGTMAVSAAQPDRKTIKVVRTRQPINYVELDQNNPLARGAYAWTPRVPFMWAGRRPARRALSELNAVVGASGDGITRRWTAVANAGVDFGVQQLITQSGGISALVIGAPATGTSRFIVSQRLTAASTIALELLYNDDGQGGGTSGSIALRGYDAGYKAVSATSQVDGTRHVWVLCNSTDTGFILRDGVEQTLASNTRLAGTITGTSQKLRVGNAADLAVSGSQTSESISLIIVWDRALTVTEARKIAANPWQIFKPEERVVFAAGPLSPDVTVALSGVSGTLSLGSYSLTSAVPLTGVLGTGAVGALLPVSAFAATGVSGTLSTGSMLADTAVPLTGLASTISVGTLTAETGTIVALTGVSGTLSTGTLGVELSVPLAGVAGTAAAGTVGPVTALAATGVEGTLAVGSVLPAFSIPLAGEAITTSLGTVVVAGGTVTVALTGVSTTVSLGSLAALAVDGWTPVPTPQTPGWAAISNTQTPTWTPIIDTQTPGWTPIIT